MKNNQNTRINQLTKHLLFVAVCCGTILIAGNTGKISGVATDKQTGKPLVGANIIIQGTSFGASTNENGKYYILQVPQGRYKIMCSYIGYQKVIVERVDVSVDLTSAVNFDLEPTALEAQAVTVIAEKYMVRKDVTSTRREILKDELDASPGLESANDIFRLQGGIYIGGPAAPIEMADGSSLIVGDESLKNIHIRGGRGGEVLYLVDGMPVNHPIYGGRNVIDLNVVDIQGVELLTGAFNAEYGEAQSGVVNVTTRSGSDIFTGGVEYKTDEPEIWTPSYPTQYTAFYFGGPEFFTKKLLPKLGIKIPGKMFLFISGNTKVTNTPYNNRKTRSELSVLGFTIKEKQDNKANFNVKLNYDIFDNLKVHLNYHGSWNRWSSYNWAWNNYPDHMASSSRDNNNLTFKLNHTLNSSTFYTLNVGYLSIKRKGSLDGKSPPDFWEFDEDGRIISTIKTPTADPLNGFYDELSYQNIWRDDYTETYTVKGDITSQIGTEHLVKTGMQIQYNEIQYVDIQDGGVKLSNYGRYIYESGDEAEPPFGPFKEFGQLRWVFDAYPVIGGAYIQDKFEKESIIINAGLRFDWFMPGSSVMDKTWQKDWEKATGLIADWPSFRYILSPRFGISYPISTETVLFFSYGHFNQLPELQYVYRDPYSGLFTGNPHLTYEETILYEFGFSNQFSENWAVDIKSYAKDISKQVGITAISKGGGTTLQLNDNKGYARVRGLEFELKKRSSGLTSGTVTYTLQWADGYSSSAFDDYKRSVTNIPIPIRERRLNWDIRHQVILRAMIFAPKNSHISLFGLKLPDNWQISILSNFASGNPYTAGTYSVVEQQTLRNAATGPFVFSTDVKLNKSFTVSGINYSLFMNIFNVFDQKNVQLGYGFNRWTGKPYKYGDTITNTPQYWNYYDMYRLMTPQQFSIGRYMDFGLRVNF